MNKQEELIQYMQGSTKTNMSHMEHLSELIEKLEEQMADIRPQRLKLNYNEMEPNT